jgi:hypothetical protein
MELAVLPAWVERGWRPAWRESWKGGAREGASPLFVFNPLLLWPIRFHQRGRLGAGLSALPARAKPGRILRKIGVRLTPVARKIR